MQVNTAQWPGRMLSIVQPHGNELFLRLWIRIEGKTITRGDEHESPADDGYDDCPVFGD